MAAHLLKKTRSHQPTFFDTFGYGSRPQRPSSFSTMLVSAAFFFHFGLLPILWNVATSVPSIVWTGTSTGLLCLAALAARHSSITSRKVSICTITFLFAYPIFGWISYKAWGQYSGERETMLLQTLPIMLLGLALYLTGAAARSHRIYRTIWMTWLLMACYVLLNAKNFSVENLYQTATETGNKLTYQQLGDSFAICSTILAARIRQAPQRWLFIAAAIGLMFIIPSRSAAFFGTASLLTVIVLFGGFFTRVVVIGLVVAIGLGYETGLFAQLFEGTRFQIAFTPGSEDGSWSTRQEIMNHGMNVLTSRPFTGEWAFQLGEMKFAGLYIHNILDIWAQTGLISFLLFLAIWGALLVALMTGFERWPRIAKETAPLLVFVVLSWCLARNVTFVALFFCVGFASAALEQARFGQVVRRHRADQLNTQFNTQFSPDSQFVHSQFAPNQFANSQFANSQFAPQTQLSPDTRFVRRHQYQDHPKYQDHTKFFPPGSSS